MTRKKRTIDNQTFVEIGSFAYYHSDKTALALRLTDEDSHYLLSRPRRFGKMELYASNNRFFGQARE